MAVLDVKGKLRRKDGKLIILCQIAVFYATFSVYFEVYLVGLKQWLGKGASYEEISHSLLIYNNTVALSESLLIVD